MNIKSLRFSVGLTVILLLGFQSIKGQLKILSSSFSNFNVSQESMCAINISNSGEEVNGVIEAKITGVSGGVIATSVSYPMVLKKGVNNTLQLGLKIANANYANTTIAEYIKLYHQLPSGKYNYCVSIKLSDGNGDELCDELESENSSFLTLVTPPDKDTTDNINPLLVWNHSEPFNLLQQGEFFRIIVTEMKEGQTAEAAIGVNSPKLQQNFLTRHDIQYPFDAPKLEAGKSYAWQVQKVANNVITNKTDVWQFSIGDKYLPSKYYVEITPKLNTTIYPVRNGVIYFLYKEEYYTTTKNLKCEVTDDKGKVYNVSDKNQGKAKSALKQTGVNNYELNIEDLKLKNGFYVLHVYNEKNQDYLLKFQITD